jgi:hypothetical protein
VFSEAVRTVREIRLDPAAKSRHGPCIETVA